MFFSIASYLITYSTFHLTSETAGVHPANSYKNSSVDSFSGISPSYVGVVPYATSSSVSITFHFSSFHVTVYLFTIYLYLAVYSASHWTSEISGIHPTNSYVKWASAGCDASSWVGTSPYATDVVSLTVQSSFFHVIV